MFQVCVAPDKYRGWQAGGFVLVATGKPHVHMVNQFIIECHYYCVVRQILHNTGIRGTCQLWDECNATFDGTIAK